MSVVLRVKRKYVKLPHISSTVRARIESPELCSSAVHLPPKPGYRLVTDLLLIRLKRDWAAID